MNKKLTVSYWAMIILAVISLFVLIESTFELFYVNKINAFIAKPNIEQAPDNPYSQFALAYQLERADKPQDALDIYTQLLTNADQALKSKVYYNRGLISLKQAAMMEEGNPKQNPLIELAKQDFRHALELEPSFWDARFNLEYALNLVPELPINDENFEKEEISSSRSIEAVAFRVDLP